MGAQRLGVRGGSGPAIEPVTARSRKLLKDAEEILPSLPAKQVTPTKQPATWGQDMQECGYLYLPQHIQLAPKSASVMHMAGAWESLDGATFAAWSQALWPWSLQEWSMDVGLKLFILAAPVMSTFRSDQRSALEDLGMYLPQRDGFKVPVVFRDCNGVPMYAVMERDADPLLMEVYNREGQFVAGSRRGDSKGEEIRFHDETGAPLAYAVRLQAGGATSSTASQGSAGPRELAPWQIQFFDQTWTNSTLALPQNRWVIAASVQERALEEAAQQPHILVVLGCIGLLLAALAFCAGLVFLLGLGIWRAVFPRRKTTNVRNIFLEDFQAYPAPVLESQQ
mmetsp:Transcript_34834/g.81353  ORF Transcript_34834/g.81353 Transcript_34834/m.81353 type:complete len:338 (+) Transcript_34834:128-1141(+)